MIRGKNAEGEWKTILGAIILVILIFVGYLFVSKIILGGKSFNEIIDCAKNKDWKCLFGKEITTSLDSPLTDPGNGYICGKDKFHEMIVDGKSIFAKMEKCVAGTAIIGLYSENNAGTLLDTITITDGSKVCSPKSKAGVCIKLYSVVTSGKTPIAIFSYTSLSQAFDAVVLTPGTTKTFTCNGGKEITVTLVSYYHGIGQGNDAFLSISGITGIPSVVCSRHTGSSESGWDNKENLIRCVDGGSFSCGDIKIVCGTFVPNRNEIQIIHCDPCPSCVHSISAS